MSDLPVLYSFRRCPFAMRARWALWVAGIAVAHREIVLRDKPAAMLAASPKGTVPVLVLPAGAQQAHGVQVIDESLDVMLWALAQHDPEAWLRPARGSLAEMLALIEACQTQFKPHLDRSKYPQRYAAEVLAWAGQAEVDAGAGTGDGAVVQAADGPAAGTAGTAGTGGAAQPAPSEAALAAFVAEHRQHARAFLLALQAHLLQGSAEEAGSGSAAEGGCAVPAAEQAVPETNAADAGKAPAGPALFGTRPALADFAIAPFVRQFAQADAAHWQAGDWPVVRTWLAAMLARPEFDAEVMRKHALWVDPQAVAADPAPSRASLG